MTEEEAAALANEICETDRAERKRLQDYHEAAARLQPIGVVARRLGVKRGHLMKACERGELPHVRIGDDILMDQQAITCLLLGRAQTKPTP